MIDNFLVLILDNVGVVGCVVVDDEGVHLKHYLVGEVLKLLVRQQHRGSGFGGDSHWRFQQHLISSRPEILARALET